MCHSETFRSCSETGRGTENGEIEGTGGTTEETGEKMVQTIATTGAKALLCLSNIRQNTTSEFGVIILRLRVVLQEATSGDR